MGAFERIKSFIADVMNMKQVYQPMMLIRLLESEGGWVSSSDLAEWLRVNSDGTQASYITVLHSSPGRTLVKHRIASKEGEGYALNGFEDLNATQKADLVRLCRKKLQEYQ